MTNHSTVPFAILLAALGSVLPACSVLGWRIRSPITRDAEEARFGPGELSAAAIQSELMSFTDTFDSAVAEQWNKVAAESRATSEAPEGPTSEVDAKRASRNSRSAIENKLATVSAALSIASSPNPTVALADMITMVTLQRMVLEEPVTVDRYGEGASTALRAMYRGQEEKLWRIAARAMSTLQQEELKALILEWRAQNPETNYVANIRLEDFAKLRQQAIVETDKSGDSLLSLIALDPLAGLDPAQREVQKSRMLGERMFFYGSRMPQVLKWHVESLSQELLRGPELVQVSSSMEKVTDSIARVTTVAERLPVDFAAERSAALDDLFSKVAEARRAAVADVDQALTAQREALLVGLDQAGSRIQSTLVELSTAAGITDKTAATLTGTIRAADAFAARFERAPGADARPEEAHRNVFAHYQAAVAETGNAAERLTVLAKSLDELLDSPRLDQEPPALRAVVLDVQARAKNVIDYAFLRLLVLVLLTPFVVAFAAGLYRRSRRRHGARATALDLGASDEATLEHAA